MPLHSLLPLSLEQDGYLETLSPTPFHPTVQSANNYCVNEQRVPFNDQKYRLPTITFFLLQFKTLPCLQGGHTSGKHLAGELDRGWKEIWCLLFTMRLNLESKYAATACWMGGDSRLRHTVCADQATGGSDRLETAGLGPALCWIAFSKGLSVTVPFGGVDGDRALGDKVSGHLGSAGTPILLSWVRKAGYISAGCNCV